MKYRIYYAGKPSLADPYGLLRLVFTGEYVEASSDGVSVTGTYANPQTPREGLPATITIEEITLP